MQWLYNNIPNIITMLMVSLLSWIIAPVLCYIFPHTALQALAPPSRSSPTPNPRIMTLKPADPRPLTTGQPTFIFHVHVSIHFPLYLPCAIPSSLDCTHTSLTIEILSVFVTHSIFCGAWKGNIDGVMGRAPRPSPFIITGLSV